MNIKCTSCHCILFVPDSSFKIAIPKVKCPFCNTFFKPVVAAKNILKKPTPSVTEPIWVSNNLISAKGWLVVHDEKTKAQTFELKSGSQLIGRKSTTKPCDIMIETDDPYMSRNHFVIEVTERPNGMLAYSLSDSGSKNRTYKNLVELKANDAYYLNDGDTIQAGETKIIFKTTDQVKTARQATQLVSASSYNKTVLVK